MIHTPRPLPIILDTDIGDDIDDALALGLILNSPELALYGVTTVFADAGKRAELTRKMLHVWQCADIPVAAGFSEPLREPIDYDSRHHFGAQFGVGGDEGQFAEESDDAPEKAIELIARFAKGARGRDEKFTVLAIGALTNVAKFLETHPELATHTRLIMMGGQGLSGGEAEWNILCDPEAAAQVMASDIEIWQVGFDITTQVQLNAGQLAQLAVSDDERVQFLSRLIQLWRGEEEKLPYLHDPLAVLAFFTDCLRFEPRRARVILDGSERGLVHYSEITSRKAPCHVAVEVDVERAITIFLNRIQDWQSSMSSDGEELVRGEGQTVATG